MRCSATIEFARSGDPVQVKWWGRENVVVGRLTPGSDEVESVRVDVMALSATFERSERSVFSREERIRLSLSCSTTAVIIRSLAFEPPLEPSWKIWWMLPRVRCMKSGKRSFPTHVSRSSVRFVGGVDAGVWRIRRPFLYAKIWGVVVSGDWKS